MNEKRAEEIRIAPMQVFDCEMISVPPGTKAKARLPRGEEALQEPSVLRPWLLGGGAVVVALLAGILIGRFLLS